jgi:hypothetical protein
VSGKFRQTTKQSGKNVQRQLIEKKKKLIINFLHQLKKDNEYNDKGEYNLNSLILFVQKK